jgi:hypothetical protein
MSDEKMGSVRLVDGGGVLIDDEGNEHFLRGYGAGLHRPPLDLDPRIDLTKPIWEQVQRLERKDNREAGKRPKAA